MENKKLVAGIGLGLGALALAACAAIVIIFNNRTAEESATQESDSGPEIVGKSLDGAPLVEAQAIKLEEIVTAEATVNDTDLFVLNLSPEGVVTAVLVEPGDTLKAGSQVAQIGDRPVFVLAGANAASRDLELGIQGDDVLQLEKALQELGYNVGTVDSVYDVETSKGVESFYADRGVASPLPPQSAIDESKKAAEGVTLSTSAVSTATKNLADKEAANERTIRPLAQLNARKALEYYEAKRQRAQHQNCREPYARRTLAKPDPDPEKQYQDVRKMWSEDGFEPLCDSGTPLGRAVVNVRNAYEARKLAGAKLRVAEANDNFSFAFNGDLDRARAADKAAAATYSAANKTMHAAIAAATEAQNDALDSWRTAHANLEAAENNNTTTAEERALSNAKAALVAANAAQEAAESKLVTPFPRSELAFVDQFPRTTKQVDAAPGASGGSIKLAGSDLEITSSVPADQAGKLEVGMVAAITSDDGDESFEAEIVSIGEDKLVSDSDTSGLSTANSADSKQPTNNAGPATIRFKPLGAISGDLAGKAMSATVTIELTKETVLAVPPGAINEPADQGSLGKPTVKVQLSDGTFEIIEVVLGERTNNMAEIKSSTGDLKAGDKLELLEGDSAKAATDENAEQSNE